MILYVTFEPNLKLKHLVPRFLELKMNNIDREFKKSLRALEKQIFSKYKIKPVLSTLESKRTLYVIEEDEANNFVHKQTGFIFDRQTQKVIGKYDSEGANKIIALNESDIDTCNQYKFDYELPLNLDTTFVEDMIRQIDDLELTAPPSEP